MKTTEVTPRYERMRLDRSDCLNRVAEVSNDLLLWGRYNDVCGATSAENPTFESYDGRDRDLFICFEQIQLCQLEIPHPFGRLAEIVATASQLAVDLFCGSWRDCALLHSGRSLDRKECRAKFDRWFDQYRIGLLVTLLSGDPQSVNSVAQYTGDDLFPDEGSWDRTPYDRLVYSSIKSHIVNGSRERSYDEQIASGRPKRPKLILKLLQAIENDDAAGFLGPFMDLVATFCKSEFHPKSRVVTSIDASVIWALARRSGLRVTTQTNEIMDYVIADIGN